jgi:hypothetical protein
MLEAKFVAAVVLDLLNKIESSFLFLNSIIASEARIAQSDLKPSQGLKLIKSSGGISRVSWLKMTDISGTIPVPIRLS